MPVFRLHWITPICRPIRSDGRFKAGVNVNWFISSEAHKHLTNQSLSLSLSEKHFKNSFQLDRTLHELLKDTWAGRMFAKTGDLNLGSLDERLCLPVQGHPAASVWLNVTGDIYLRPRHHSAHISRLLRGRVCANWDSLWQTCII